MNIRIFAYRMNKSNKERSVKFPRSILEVSQSWEGGRSQVSRPLAPGIFLRTVNYRTVEVSRFSRCYFLLCVLVLQPDAYTFFIELDERLPPPDSFITPRNHYLLLTQKVRLNCQCSNQTGVKYIYMIDVPFRGKQLKI